MGLCQLILRVVVLVVRTSLMLISFVVLISHSLYLFRDSLQHRALNQQLDKLGKGDEKSAGPQKSAFHGAKAMWQASTDKGHKAGADAAASSAKETVLATKHQNTIT